jgi:hypothetical protein
MREAFKRSHMIAQRADVAALPVTRFVLAVQAAWENPALKKTVGPLILRLAGVPGDVLTNPLTEAEKAAAARMSFDELAADALSAKRVH